MLKIATFNNQPWFGKDLAYSLSISSSEVSESLNRSAFAGLLDDAKQKLMKQSFFEFLEFQSKESFVWPDATGEYRGQAIEPLHPGIVNAARIDAKFYELISLADALRIGRTREQSLAIQELKKRI